MIKRFRAYDGDDYWYADENLLFVNGAKALELRLTPFELKDVEQFIGKSDSKGIMIYENDLVKDQQTDRVYKIIWSDAYCGFRKVSIDNSFFETKIDEAFMKVIGTIHSQGE